MVKEIIETKKGAPKTETPFYNKRTTTLLLLECFDALF